MKRFASHYLLLPGKCFIKQQVVEIAGDGVVRRIFPLTEEIESVEWMPGVIVLLPADRMEELKNNGVDLKDTPLFSLNLPVVSDLSSCCVDISSDESKKKGEALFPYLFYPFDFTSMQPVDGTRHRLLR